MVRQGQTQTTQQYATHHTATTPTQYQYTYYTITTTTTTTNHHNHNITANTTIHHKPITITKTTKGYPPFYSDDPLTTCRKIVGWRAFLKFPPEARVAPACRDLIERLMCDADERLGAHGVEVGCGGARARR